MTLYNNFAPPWWESDEETLHLAVFKHVRALEEDQKEDRTRMLRYMRLYDPSAALVGADIENRGEITVTTFHQENYTKSVVDTAAAMLAKNRPRPTFQTDGADWSTQRQAKQLEQFMEGEFARIKAYSLGPEIFRDAEVVGLGAIHGYVDEGKVCFERVIWDELIVDEMESRYSNPKTLHRRKFVDRDELIKAYPEYEDEIKQAKVSDEDDVTWTTYRAVDPRLVPVIYSWRLPVTGDGVESACIPNKCLYKKEYSRDFLPFVFYRWNTKITGFWGTGVIQEIASLQRRINRINAVITKHQDLFGVHRALFHISDANDQRKMDNTPGRVIFYRQQKPEFITPPALQPEMYAEKERLIQRMYQLAGVSQDMAQAQKPQDLESAVALREKNDIDTMRFSLQAQRYEEFYMDLAKLDIALQKELHANNGTSEVTYRTKNISKKITWSKVDMDEAVYSMSIEAASITSMTPAGRTQQVIDLSQAGFINQDEARRLLGHPDVKRVLDLETAAMDDAERTVEMLLEGEYEPPEPAQNLQLCTQVVTQAFLKAKADKAPEDILDNFRSWLADAAALQQTAMQPPPVPVTPPPIVPGGAQSPLANIPAGMGSPLSQ